MATVTTEDIGTKVESMIEFVERDDMPLAIGVGGDVEQGLANAATHFSNTQAYKAKNGSKISMTHYLAVQNGKSIYVVPSTNTEGLKQTQH